MRPEERDDWPERLAGLMDERGWVRVDSAAELTGALIREARRALDGGPDMRAFAQIRGEWGKRTRAMEAERDAALAEVEGLRKATTCAAADCRHPGCGSRPSG